jgi:hypothetical protein
VLDRALLYVDVVADRSHALRGQIRLDADDASQGIVGSIDATRRKAIERCFAWLRRQPNPETTDTICSDLAGQIHHIIQNRHPVSE